MNPTEILQTTHGASPAEPLTPDALEDHLQRMAHDAARVSLDRLLEEQPISCVDGRKAECVIGAPGGNAGLFVLLLAAYELHTGRRLQEAVVGELFDHYLQRFGHFYLHTDTEAVERLRQAMADDERLRPFARDWISLQDAEAFLRTPSVDIRDALLDLLLQPRHVGCGHLRLMLEHPDAYGTRRALVEAVLRAFFTALWDGNDRLVFEVLRGDHQERAVVNVHTNETGHPGQAVPITTTCPHYEDLKVFVNHPEAVAYLEAEHALFLARCGLVPLDDIAPFIRTQQQLSERQLHTTLHHLAPDLPVYEVAASPQGFKLLATVRETHV